MDLITPQIGLVFWTGLVFLILLFILTKFAWKPILNMVNEREQKISEALALAEKTNAEMKALQAKNEESLKEARAERDAMIKDAREVSAKMIEDSKSKAKEEADKIIVSSRQAMEVEKAAAISELKAQVALLSVEIAEKIVKAELASDAKQQTLANQLAEGINLN